MESNICANEVASNRWYIYKCSDVFVLQRPSNLVKRIKTTMCLDLEFNKKTIYFTGDTLTFLAFNLRIGSYIFIVILRYVKQQKREEIIRLIKTAQTSEIIKKT